MKKYLYPAALLLGFSFDILFWEKIPGISFSIFVVLSLAAGFFLIKAEKLRPAKASLVLLLPILFLSVMAFIRKEPFTSFLNVSLTLFWMAVLAMTYLGGQWRSFGLADYIANFFHLIGGMVTLPWLATSEKDPHQVQHASQTWLKHAGPTLRGLLLAIPVLLLFTALFSAADLVFAKRVSDVIANLNLENLPEYLLRAVLIFLVAYFFSGIILHAAKRSDAIRLIGMEKPLVPTFLGFTETTIILTGVLLLFSAFVIIQFEYLFFGQANITLQGFTYAEYARRGFGELVAVAVFSLALIKGLSTVAKLEPSRKAKAFSWLTCGLVALVLIILVSAFQRLSLYEGAYGFSRLRAYAHVFIIWLGILLMAAAIMEIARRQRAFANIALAVLFGFSVSLNLLNVDGFIAHSNINRTGLGEKLDVSYLASLSSDALPVLAENFSANQLSPKIRESIGAALVCIQQNLEESPETQKNWQSFHFSTWNARRELQKMQPSLEGYQFQEKNWPPTVTSPDGTEYACQNPVTFD